MLKNFLLSLMLSICFSAEAGSFKIGDITVHQPWARGGASMMAGYMKLENQGKADRLLTASSEVSEALELHQHVHDNGIMRMRKIDSIVLPAKETIELKPQGLHLMFIRLKKPLAQGEHFTVTLHFEKAGKVPVEFVVDAKGQANSPK